MGLFGGGKDKWARDDNGGECDHSMGTEEIVVGEDRGKGVEHVEERCRGCTKPFGGWTRDR